MNINEVAVGLEEVTSALIVIGGYGMPRQVGTLLHHGLLTEYTGHNSAGMVLCCLPFYLNVSS